MRRLARRLPGSRTLTTPALSAVLILLASLTLAGSLFSGIKFLAGDTEPVSLMALDSRATQAVARVHPPIDQTATTSAPQDEALPAMDAQVAAPARVAPPSAPTAEAATPVVMTFDGRPLRKVRTLSMSVTAYSPDERSCGKWADGITASGYSVWTNGMKLVAADTRVLPFGTIITVPGYNHGKPVPVLDRGGAIKGHRLDVLYPTHEVAMQWGVQKLSVDVWEYADE